VEGGGRGPPSRLNRAAIKKNFKFFDFFVFSVLWRIVVLFFYCMDGKESGEGVNCSCGSLLPLEDRVCIAGLKKSSIAELIKHEGL
jgi:hypothetical protein